MCLISPLCVVCCYKSEFTGTGSQNGLIARDREQLNRGLQMTRNPAARIGQWRSRTGRFPWFFPSLIWTVHTVNWPQSGGRLKDFMRLVAIGFAYCELFLGGLGQRTRLQLTGRASSRDT